MVTQVLMLVFMFREVRSIKTLISFRTWAAVGAGPAGAGLLAAHDQRYDSVTWNSGDSTWGSGDNDIHICPHLQHQHPTPPPPFISWLSPDL